ncbi:MULTISPECIES: hypothetical protein [unclassified Arthrobacter]|nr:MULTISPECIES: hypothetical protein [unclassified Arthrobacter]
MTVFIDDVPESPSAARRNCSPYLPAVDSDFIGAPEKGKDLGGVPVRKND